MSLTTNKITELAPDQASLKAANKLMKPAKWPVLAQCGELVWGECQGSGANPYRTVFDNANAGYKCTCPSRKFPCKHVLALMWMFVEDPGPFATGELPTWVTDWMGRRRNTGAGAANESPAKTAQDRDAKAGRDKSGGKSLAMARAQEQAEPAQPLDPQVAARRQAAAKKRAEATRRSIAGGLDELQQWLEDQIRGGLGAFLADPGTRCRTIAARLVDAKAQALASRLDELPARLLQAPGEHRLNLLVQELGRVVLIARAWRADPEDAELARLVGSSETRESVLENSQTTRVASTWEVVGEQVLTRRDGLVSQSTWLINLGKGLRFAQLLDFFPASLGKRSSVFAVGECFTAELAYYPAQHPLRAVIARRPAGELDARLSSCWPEASGHPLDEYRNALQPAPWIDAVPLLLPAGRIGRGGAGHWWESADGRCRLPLAHAPSRHVAGLAMEQTVAVWDGLLLTLLSSQSQWGKLSYGA